MAYVLKKIHVAIATLLITVVGQVYSDNSHSTDKELEDDCSCESAWSGKGFIKADLLYLRTIEGGVDASFPVKNINHVSSNGTLISKSKVKDDDPHFNWTAGFRLGTGYELTSGWDIAVFWMHMHSHASRHYRNADKFRNKFENRWKLDFNVVDAIFGRKFKIGSSVTFTPFAGLRGAEIKQKLRTNFITSEEFHVESSSASSFSDLSPTSFSVNQLIKSHMHNKQRFFGIGPLLGLVADFDVGCGFIVYANASLAGLYAYSHVRLSELDNLLAVEDMSIVKKRLSVWQGVVDLGVGVRWHTSVYGSNMWLQLGLEHHVYLGHNHIAVYGDLALDGANFAVGLEF
jgi:hypothetical protein